MTKPDFLIIGAAKSGTTSLYHYLNQHPQIFMSPVKEPNYFALKDGIEYKYKSDTMINKGYEEGFCFKEDKYLNLFKKSNENQLCGEASPIYLWYENAAKNIYDFNKKIKLIVILRNPVDRAYSNFKHHLNASMETTKNFTKALKLEKKRKQKDWWWGYFYYEAGLYYTQLQRYFNIFPSKQIHVLTFEQFVNSQNYIIKSIFKFLDISTNIEIHEIGKKKSTYFPKSILLEKLRRSEFYNKIKNYLPENFRSWFRNNNKTNRDINKDVRLELTKKFKPEILQLEKLVNKDLSKWYEE